MVMGYWLLSLLLLLLILFTFPSDALHRSFACFATGKGILPYPP